MVAAVAVSTAMLGCGEIVEVPVAMSETGRTESETGSSEPTGGDATGQATETTDVPDVDDAPTSGMADDGASSSGGEPPLQSIPFCLTDRDEGFMIPEDATQSTAIEVGSVDGEVVGLQVTLRVAHPRLSDLHVVLSAPDGTLIRLLDEPACNGANVNAMFQDDAAEVGNEVCLTDDTAAITGPVRALEDLDAVLGASVGTWTLEATDTVPGEAGSLDQLCVVLITEGG